MASGYVTYKLQHTWPQYAVRSVQLSSYISSKVELINF